MNKLIFFFFLFNFSAFSSEFSAGDSISAIQYNNKTFQIGDIKISALSSLKFFELHGNCWRLMDGSSITGTDLATLTGNNYIPDALSQGAFIRQAKTGRQLGSYEADELKSHSHSYETSRALDSSGRQSSYIGYGQNSSRGNYSGKIFASGGEETRPKNIAMNFFMRVNKECQ